MPQPIVAVLQRLKHMASDVADAMDTAHSAGTTARNHDGAFLTMSAAAEAADRATRDYRSIFNAYVHKFHAPKPPIGELAAMQGTITLTPATYAAFVLGHADLRTRQKDVARIQQLNHVRNRAAHHEPIHWRDLAKDLESVLDLAAWISSAARKQVSATASLPDGRHPLRGSPRHHLGGSPTGRLIIRATTRCT